MILTFEDLPKFRGSVSMVDGAFDPLHAGHVEYFRVAADLGKPLLCNVASDQYVRTKHPPLLPDWQRAVVLDALRDIAYTHVSEFDTEAVLEQLRPYAYVKGKDWEGHLPLRQVEVCGRLGIRICYLDTVRDSSSRLLRAYAEGAAGASSMSVSEFEHAAYAQRPTSSDHYDSSYFRDQWRAEGNDYSLETRRRIEGRNPELIRHVFKPNKVLDLGCGPGALMHLLAELGVEVDGIDFSEDSPRLASDLVRDRIAIGTTYEPMKPANAYDLVICREVMEHLTVFQIRRTVENIVRTTSRFVYCTTRFHPSPVSLVDFTTQFDVDPTHMTLLNKDFLRLLFVLEGCRSRPDLEAQMDWLNKGRVLVMEKRAQDI